MKRYLLSFVFLHIAFFGFSQSSGHYDKTFKIHDLRGDIKSVTVLKKDDSIVAGGFLSTVDGQVSQNLMVFDKDSNFLRSLDIGTGPTNTVFDTYNGANDTVIITGKFKFINHRQSQGMAVFNADGTSSFAPSPGADNDVYAISADSSNCIYIGGKFAHFNKKERTKLAAITYNGSIYEAVNPHLAVSGEVHCILEVGGNIYVAGKFGGVQVSKRGSCPHKNLAKISNDGYYVDANFGKHGSIGLIRKICLQGNKLLVVGDFRQYASGRKSDIRVPQIVRVCADTGKLDTSFKIGNLDINGKINDVLIHPQDGKILICGRFTNVQGVTCNRIARLNPDGSIDKTFDSSVGASDEIRSMALQSDGKIIIGGNFRTYDNVNCNGFARIIY